VFSVYDDGSRFHRFREDAMIKLKTPGLPVFLIALGLMVLALVGYFTTVPVLTKYQFWLAVAGYLVLALGSTL
jgi:hypothetical protein